MCSRHRTGPTTTFNLYRQNVERIKGEGVMNEPLEKSTTLPAPLEEVAAKPMLAPEARSLIPSVALIGLGLILESELLIGIALGTGIVIASKWLPKAVGDAVEPILNSTVEACYSAAAETSKMLGEAAQRVGSIIRTQAPQAPHEGEPAAAQGEHREVHDGGREAEAIGTG
jgi:hypothetical protein